MWKQIQGAAWLFGLTLLFCSVLYPLALLGIGQAIFRHQAQGSLLDEKGNPETDPARARGSRLIGQPFKGDEFFQPRPSNAGNGYDASASGASNWGASNPLLRSRVARQIGPIVKYASTSPTKPGQLVGGDIEGWFKTRVEQEPGFVSQWVKDHATLAEQWVKDNPAAVARWLNQSEDDVKGDTGKATEAFFASYVQKHPGTWPTVEEQTKTIKPVQDRPDVQSYFFDLWLQANRDAMQKGDIILEKVPADMVMSSGSGLDPHITLKNALYQLDRVAGKWAETMKRDPVRIRQEVIALLHQKSASPLGGLAGVELVNVLEVNLALAQHFGR